MISSVTFTRTWSGARRRYYDAHCYRVPRDITEREARLAVSHGVASANAELQAPAICKMPAPENKVVAAAPENKAPRRTPRHINSRAKLTPWCVPAMEWRGKTVVCIGGGPSLTRAQVDYVRQKSLDYLDDLRVIAINDAYRLAPWADVLYACDYKWWTWHPDAVKFAGVKITHSKKAAEEWPALKWLPGENRPDGLSIDPSKLHCGRNSGYQAINVASLYGAWRIILIGYDMRRVNDQSHWFGEHPDKVKPYYPSWIKHYETIVPQLSELGLKIINATPNSALRCFPMMDLEAALP